MKEDWKVGASFSHGTFTHGNGGTPDEVISDSDLVNSELINVMFDGDLIRVSDENKQLIEKYL